MKIEIIGGGPAGMYFAILMKKADPARDITVYERNGPSHTFGWGVVFSGRTLNNLCAADEPSHAEILKKLKTWENVDVVHRDQKISIYGNSFSGIARIDLLNILLLRCIELDVDVVLRSEQRPEEINPKQQDLLVGADGVNSSVRTKYKRFFRPDLSIRPNKYIWYGTKQLFHGLTLTFRENDAGVFAAHSYKFSEDTSTFIVECDAKTWINADFRRRSEEDTRAYLEDVFAADLKGQKLLSNNSKWINFVLVKNAHWYHRNVVLLGDALHTAHFSIGSGTKLAMEDAIALADCFAGADDISIALRKFEELRKPIIDDYQAAAFESMLWFEQAQQYMALSPVQLAYSLMTRSGRVNLEDLKKRDPDFVAGYLKSTEQSQS